MLRQYPFLLLLTGLLCGLALGALGAGWQAVALSVLLAAGVYAGLLLLSRTPGTAVKAAPFHYCWIAMLAIAVGIASYCLHRPYSGDGSGYPFVIGTVEEACQTTSSARLLVHATGFTDAQGQVKEHPKNLNVMLYSERYFEPGTRICFIRDLQPLEESPNVQNDVYTRWLQSCGVSRRQWLSEDAAWAIGSDNSLRYTLRRFRDSLVDRLDASRLSEKSVQLIAAIALGDHSLLDEEALQAFRLSGLGHLLAISGLHIGVVALLLSILLLPLTIIASAKWRRVAVILLLWCYACLTGLQTAAVRACVMTSFCMGALILERRNNSMNALMAAAFFILIFDPNQIFMAGFQLSFVAAAMLILSASLNPVDRHRHRVVFKVVEGVLTTTAAMTGTLALSAYHFHNIPLSAFVPNILICSLMPFYLGLGLLYIGCVAVGFDFSWMAWIIDRGTDGLIYLSEGTASRSVLQNVWVHDAVPLLITASLLCLMFWLRTSRKLIGVSGIVPALGAVVCMVWLPSGKPRDGFIVQQSRTDRMAVYADGMETIVDMEKGTAATLDISEQRVAWCCACVDSLPDCHYLLLGDGFDGDLSQLRSRPQIVMMKSLYDGDREQILRDCRRLRLPCHDIASSGPLRRLR